MGRTGPSSRWKVLLVAVGLALWPISAAHAHRAPLLLAFWGGFDVASAHCQRMIGRAAERCASRTWIARSRCLAARVAGADCDTAATDASIQRTHLETTDFLEQECSPDTVQPLSFFLNIELEAGIDTACRASEDALASAVYGPALRGDSMRSVPDAAKVCVGVTAEAAGRLLLHGVTPIAALSGVGQTGSTFCFLFGTTTPFDAATLASLYPKHSAYVSAFSKATSNAVKAGFILKPDATLMKAAAKASAVGT